jgi:hypothetical protein
MNFEKLCERLEITVGPWGRLDDYNRPGASEGYDLGGSIVAMDEHSQTYIATVEDCFNQEGDSRVLSVALEMLETCIETILHLENESGGWGYLIDLCRSSIFKATGRTWEEVKEIIDEIEEEEEN